MITLSGQGSQLYNSLFYRDALADACAQLSLRVIRAPERDLWPMAAGALALDEDKLRERLRDIGKRIGAPWGEDQKLATLAAALACRGARAPRGRAHAGNS